MNWKTNAAVLWNGNVITDHGRGPINETLERVGSEKRMANGTMRRQHIANKRNWTLNWENLPSTNTVSTSMKTVDGGWSGEQIESFYKTTPGKFRLVLRRGSAKGKAIPNPAESALPYEDNDFYITNVMFTSFTKEVRQRGAVDLWALSCTLEEV